MSKIICDVCGTSYPETANQCPICGCVRPADAMTVRGDTNDAEVSTGSNYTHVKGGRFSKANVKKRNQGKAAPAAPAPQKEEAPKKAGKGDKAMIITVFLLLIAIVAIVIYIAVYFFVPGQSKPDPDQNSAATTEQTVETTEATVLEISCEALDVSDTVIELDKAGAALLLNVTPTPVDTTDIITYATSDETVAVVTEDGKVVAAGNGEAIITITCGEITVECRVICTIESQVEETTVPTYSTDSFKFNDKDGDFTLSQYGATFKLYSGEIPVELITWTTDDDKVATINDGVVTAVGPGTTKVYAEYGGIKLECIVRCAESVKAPEQTQAQTPAEKAYKISHKDVTIEVGETFKLTLEDKDGKKVDVAWISADRSICTVSDGVVTGVNKGQTTVSITIDGETHSCRVIVVTKK